MYFYLKKTTKYLYFGATEQPLATHFGHSDIFRER